MASDPSRNCGSYQHKQGNSHARLHAPIWRERRESPGAKTFAVSQFTGGKLLVIASRARGPAPSGCNLHNSSIRGWRPQGLAASNLLFFRNFDRETRPGSSPLKGAGPGHTVLKHKSVAEISLGQIRDFTVVNFISRNLESSRAAGIVGWSTKKAEGRILKPFEWDYL